MRREVLHHGEALEAPLEVGDLVDEAEFDTVGWAEVVDPGVEVLGVALFGFVVEDGVDGGGESMFEGVLGGCGFAFWGGWALGFGSVDAGLLGAGEFFGDVDTGFRWGGGGVGIGAFSGHGCRATFRLYARQGAFFRGPDLGWKSM